MAYKSRSHAFADGVAKFAWRVKQVDTERGRYVCECVTNPKIVGFGDSEQAAIKAANAAMEKAVDSSDVPMPGPGSKL